MSASELLIISEKLTVSPKTIWLDKLGKDAQTNCGSVGVVSHKSPFLVLLLVLGQ